MTEKTCKTCIHFDACSKWTDFPSQCGVPVCAKFKEQSEWISVDERLPEETCECLAIDAVGVIYLVNYSGSYRAFNAIDCDDGDRWKFNNITHWMPLPEPPKGEQNEPS